MTKRLLAGLAVHNMGSGPPTGPIREGEYNMMTQPAKRLPGALLWEKASVFAMGGTAYLAAELVWRGATHWTMFFAGGGCFCLLVWLEHCPNLTLPSAAALGAAGITVLELAVGQLCLVALRVRVWDYRAEWGNIAGFVCPRYTVLWYLLCLWLLFCLRKIRAAPHTVPLLAAEY